MKMKVANAFTSASGKHQIIWLAGGYAVYLFGDGRQEIFETLDEAMKLCDEDVVHDPELLKKWAEGYDLPADEDHKWPKIFLQSEGAQGD